MRCNATLNKTSRRFKNIGVLSGTYVGCKAHRKPLLEISNWKIKMDDTLDTLPNEGKRTTVTKTTVMCRHECEICGEAAHYKHTYLLEGNPRRNPASRAYGRDDCSWCEDTCKYVCKEHLKDRTPPDGYEFCSTFPASSRFAHLFLYEVTV